jgi:hypothetical protein
MRDPKVCAFCYGDSFQNPCPHPRGAHFEGIEIHSGPHKDFTYVYTVHWYDEDRMRGRGQVFRTIPTLAVKNSPEWSDAWAAYRRWS